MTKEYGVTHFTELHRTLHKNFLIWRCQMNNPFSLLRNKEIIAILDGDTKYGDYEFEDFSTIKKSMPYLSGADLRTLSTLFGLPETYSWNGGALSRRQYLDNLLEVLY